jgi:hypothetical protein
MKRILILLMMAVCTFSCITYESDARDTPYKIGDRGPAGGWIFYDKGHSSGGWRFLEAAPEDQGEAAWGCPDKSIPGAQGAAIGTGKGNTKAIIKACGQADIAAGKAADYRGGGRNDWFLPSQWELHAIFKNLFKKGIGGFNYFSHWSSSAISADSAWVLTLDDGNRKTQQLKRNIKRVRAIRAF